MDDPQESHGPSILEKVQDWVRTERVLRPRLEHSFHRGSVSNWNWSQPAHILTPAEREAARLKIQELLCGYNPPDVHRMLGFPDPETQRKIRDGEFIVSNTGETAPVLGLPPESTELAGEDRECYRNVHKSYYGTNPTRYPTTRVEYDRQMAAMTRKTYDLKGFNE